MKLKVKEVERTLSAYESEYQNVNISHLHERIRSLQSQLELEKLKIQKEQLDKCRESAMQMINSWRTLNSDMQFKVSYFYGPYNGITRRNPLIPMAFDEGNDENRTTKTIDLNTKLKNWK